MTRIALVILGLALCAWKFGTSVIGAETIRNEGRTVLLDLQPADPRALLLGDYMALRYAALPPRKDIEDDRLDGLAVLRDIDGVAEYQRVFTGQPLGDDEFVLRFRKRPGGWQSATYGGDRYYFQSGTAERYRDARYGVFKVMPNGHALLAGLADEEKRIIATAGEAPE